MSDGKYGTFAVDIIGCEPLLGMQDGRKYYLEVEPQIVHIFKSIPKMRTSHATSKNLGEWSLHTSLKLEAEIHSGVAFDVILKEVGAVIDTSVASGTFSIGVIADGQHMESKVTLMELKQSKSSGPQAMCVVTVTMDWEGTVPSYILKPGLEQQAPVELAPLPECEGRAFSIRIIVHKARNLQANDDNKIYNPLVSVTVADQTRKTESQKEELNPYFDEELMLMLPKVEANFWTMPIQIDVMHKPFIGPNKLIGMGQMDMASVYRCPNHFMQNKWIVLRKGEMSTQIMGFLKVSVMVLDAINDTIPEIEEEDEDEEENEEETVMGLLNAPGAAFEEVYMRCEIHKADDLPIMDSYLFSKGSCDPFVKIYYGVKKTQVAHKNQTLKPVWNTSTSLAALLPSMTDNIFVELWDYNAVTSNSLIGTHKLSFNGLTRYSNNTGLPNYPVRYVNFYGAPANHGSSSDSYFQKMNKGLIPAVDYRGRLLMGIVGTRDKTQLSGSVAKPQEMDVKVTVTVQARQFSMLPIGKFSLRLSVGNQSSAPREFQTQKMKYGVKVGSDVGCIFIGGKDIKVEIDLTCVCRHAEGNEAEATVVDQIPDVFLHIMQGQSIYASARIPASVLLPAEKVTPAAHPDLTSNSENNIAVSNSSQLRDPAPILGKGYSYYCLPFTTMSDPENSKDGMAPLGQFYISMRADEGASYSPPLPSVGNVYEVFNGLGYQIRNKTGLHGIIFGSSILDKEGDEADVERAYRLEMCVYHARQVPSADSNGLSDPYVRICWANAITTSHVQEETLNPNWNELLILDAIAVEKLPDIVIELWDWNRFSGNVFLARSILPFDIAQKISDISFDEKSDEVENIVGTHKTRVLKEWVKGFSDAKGRRLDTEILITTRILKTHRKVQTPLVKFPSKIRGADGHTQYKGYYIDEDRSLRISRYKFTLSIFSLRKMRKYRFMDIKCPTVEIDCGGLKFSTEKRQGPNPDINEQMECIVELSANPRYMPQLNIKVYDKRLGSKCLVGTDIINLGDVKYTPAVQSEMRSNANTNVQLTLERHLERKIAIINKMRPVLEASRAKREEKSGGLVGNVIGTVGNMVSVFSGGKGKILGDHSGTSEDSAPYGSQLDQPFDDVSHATTANADEDELDADGAVEKFNADQENKFEKMAANPYSDDEKKPPEANIPEAAVTDVELPWFDRFDPLEPDLLEPHEIVSRLHKLVDNPMDSTCEKQFGPFNDEHEARQLYRGFGKKRVKAGELMMMFSLSPMPGDPPLTRGVVPSTKLTSRSNIEFICRVYIMSCSHLAVKDNSIFGSASDPYPVLTLSDGATTDKKKIVKMVCRDDKKFQTLNPEYYFMRELNGTLPQHGNLRVEIFDWNRIGSDELIGYTDINLEDRWFSCRGYPANQKAGGTLCPGSYTEKRDLRDDHGQVQGRIELWVDVFRKSSVIMPPISVTPYPPIQMELRVIVWAVRDCVLTDITIHGEIMTDIYVKCWMNGMRNDRQETDVHYRSLDGSGAFNWRMIFPFVFDPRSKKIMPAKANGGLLSFFRIRKEQKKLEPALKVQIFDNDFFPGTDDFIGETSLNILKMRPTTTRRETTSLVDEVVDEVRSYCFCFKKKANDQLTLEDKQALAVEEFKRDMKYQRKEWSKEADRRLEALATQKTKDGAPVYTHEQLQVFHKQFFNDARRKSLVNALEAFTPRLERKKKGGVPNSPKQDPPLMSGGNPSPSADGEGAADGAPADQKPTFEDGLPMESTTPKYWFSCRGPKGAGRVGDVQLQFCAVRAKALKSETKLEAGRGRHEPQALPPPDRPESSFFFLTSPFKSAVHIIWKNYKYYIIAFLCCCFLLFVLYSLLSRILSIQADRIFDAYPQPADVIVQIPVTTTP